MTTDAARSRPPAPARGASARVGRDVAVAAVAVAALSLLLGAGTAYAQAVLPDVAAPLANSASGWTLVTALLVWASRVAPGPAALLGAVGFVLLTVGYTVGAALRGLAYDPVLFSVVGVVVGPFVGAAAAWLRGSGVRAAVGTALLAGIGLGEACYGLTVVGESTDAATWVAFALAGLALLGGMLARRLHGVRTGAVAVAGTAAVAGSFVLAYTALGTVGAG